MISLKTIPHDFNWQIYLEINEDLPRNYDEYTCKNHYLKFGYYENRRYRKVDFLSLVHSTNDYMNKSLYFMILKCIKIKYGNTFDMDNIIENHSKINNIIKSYSNDYIKLNRKQYLFSESDNIKNISPNYYY
jgi:hypothetical protein